MLLGGEHAEEALIADEAPDVLRHVMQLVADAPVAEVPAKLLGGAVEEGALFSGEGDGADAAEPRPVRRAGEELGVPANGAGFERLPLGLGDRGHGALERAIGGHHHVVVLEAREGERKQADGGEPAENCPDIEHRRVQMAGAEAHLQAPAPATTQALFWLASPIGKTGWIDAEQASCPSSQAKSYQPINGGSRCPRQVAAPAACSLLRPMRRSMPIKARPSPRNTRTSTAMLMSNLSYPRLLTLMKG